MRVGGRAEWLLEPATPDELREAYCAAKERGLRVRMLGGGANLLVEEGVHAGVVIATERLRRVFRPDPDAQDDLLVAPDAPEARIAPPERDRDPRLVAWCGASLPGFVRAAADLGWSGLEGIVGVPGKVGGGVTMNAGGRWGEMWDVVSTVRVLEEDGTFRDLERAECAPSYRNANLGGRVVVGAVFTLEVKTRAEVRTTMEGWLREKNAVQPVTERSVGCIFKNPDKELADGRSAGKLVDDCGGKGLSRGDAIVSPLHGNFIVNRGKATAVDVLTLIEDVRDLVAEKAGVTLEREVQVWRAD